MFLVTSVSKIISSLQKWAPKALNIKSSQYVHFITMEISTLSLSLSLSLCVCVRVRVGVGVGEGV